MKRFLLISFWLSIGFACREQEVVVAPGPQEAAVACYTSCKEAIEPVFALAGDFEKAILKLDAGEADKVLADLQAQRDKADQVLSGTCELENSDSLIKTCHHWMMFYADSVLPLYQQAATMIKYDSLPEVMVEDIRLQFEKITQQDSIYQQDFEERVTDFFSSNYVEMKSAQP